MFLFYSNHKLTLSVNPFPHKLGKSLLLNEQVENIVANGEISHYEKFIHLSQCFQKSSAAEASEASIYMGNG